MVLLQGAVLAAAISVTLAPAATAAAGEISQAQRHSYQLPAQPLSDSLRAVALTSGRNIVAPAELLQGRQAPALQGEYAPEEAVTILLQGSGLGYRAVGGGLVIESPTPVTVLEGSDIIVTGSRIRGAPISSPVIRLDQQAMRDAGQAGLAEALKTIPQNFGGGQNPGVGFNVPATSGVNVGGASTINLRGLGSDATLTLLNGNRLAYNGTRQGIDVSSIPMDMVDRVEVVADGASALYGSDAVAGVANIILKRDFDGLQLRANIGAATDGGYLDQRYSATAGQRWSSGGVIAAYEYAHNTQILSDDRSFTASRPGLTLYPASRRHAVALSAHQALTDRLEFSVDGIFNKRWSVSMIPLNAAGNLNVSRYEYHTTSESLAIAPRLRLDIGESWRVSLSGVYGEETVNLARYTYTNNVQTGIVPVCYCNNGRSVELSADGNIFSLPGGPAKLAVGAGYRDNVFVADSGPGDPGNVQASQDSYYLYGEISLPLVSPEQAIGGVHRLNLSGALRHERYPGIDSVVTPKLGIIYAPVADVALKGSWGRSFRAPTLFQQYQVLSAILYPATSLGGTGYPAGSTALALTGGNPDLKPEHAETWMATFEYAPASVPGLSAQFGYFSVRYKDRIVQPISYFSQALSDPLYAPQVQRSPDAAAVAAAVASAAQFFNATGRPLDSATVVAIVDGANVNAGRQTVQGLDMLINYSTDLGNDRGSLAAMVNASYLTSDQQTSADARVVQKAGTLFNPPHWRARGGLTWSRSELTLNSTFSLIGGVIDARTAAPVPVSGMTTLDLTARYRFAPDKGALAGLELSLSAWNIFNDKPGTIATSLPYDAGFDSTNYSAVGRLISFGISKSW
ncbi:TonB-dependent receptor [Sandaracinobacteroides hominis]|nr:TonB-dependent receptor [Sandaracinobacteroides hominis]